MSNISNSSSNEVFLDFLNGQAGVGQNRQGIALKAFVLNLAISLVLFAFELSGFFLLKSSAVGRRIYQPKTYLVQERLRVEAVPVNPVKWICRIWSLQDEELKAKCGLDGYFFIRLLRAMIIIFVPLMILIVPILLPINYHGGKDNDVAEVGGHLVAFNVTGLDRLAWQNVAPDHTTRYWAHLLCAILAISWALYRLYAEKLNFIDVRQRFLTSPEHRLKASARTVLITNIPSEYRSKEALEALYDVFVDNDDRSRLTVWVNRDYGPLRALVALRRGLRHKLEKEELKILRLVNRRYQRSENAPASTKSGEVASRELSMPDGDDNVDSEHDGRRISIAFEMDCHEKAKPWHRYLNPSTESHTTLVRGSSDKWKPVSSFKFWMSGEREKVPKTAWLRTEIARLTIEIEKLLLKLDDEEQFKKQNSAFIQFDRQMAAHMACSLVSHDKAGRMSPRFVGVAPHEIIWPNMGVTSLGRLVRTCIALVLFAAMLLLWGIPTTLLASISQLDTLRSSVHWLRWLRPWPTWIISLISGPLTAILLALLVQLVVPALMRKLAVLVGTPTRSKRELVTQDFYFTFLFIELVLVTAISSGIANVIPRIVADPRNIPTILANDLPRSANYFFNYLIIQSLGFSGSVLFQYLRLLYITIIWPWFTQTPREEAWLQTTIPHQMWANVYSLTTNFAVIGLIYCIISPMMLVFVSGTFSLFWVAYRHNYYFVQRNKVDTYGLLFNNAMSQLFAGIYVLEIVLVGLFFLVRDTQNNVACSPQAIIMIVVLAITAIFHFVMEQQLRPLYESLPVTLEDSAADAERQRFLIDNDNWPLRLEDSKDRDGIETLDSDQKGTSNGAINEAEGKSESPVRSKSVSATAAFARTALLNLKKETEAKVTEIHKHVAESTHKSRRRDVADQLAAALAGYPDELTDLSPEERNAELKAAFQDPVTREPAPIIWIPQDSAGVSDKVIKQVDTIYGRFLQYSNSGAYLTAKNKCEITQPAPDVRPDWLLEWML